MSEWQKQHPMGTVVGDPLPGAPELAAFGGARLLELASPPYGFDRAAAEELGKHVELCGGLPGKCAPQAAAQALRDTIYSVLED